MRYPRTLLAAALTLAFTACDNNSTTVDSGSGDLAEQPNSAGGTEDRSRGIAATDEGAQQTPLAQAAAGLGSANAASLADSDRHALMAVMEVDQHEVQSADEALSKDVQGGTRAYAETLRRDHARNLDAARVLLGGAGDQSGREMTTVSGGTATTTQTAAGGANLAAPEVIEMKRKHDTERAHLATLSGAAFETAWVDAMAKGHQEALGKLDSELIPGAQDPRVRAHLQQTRTAIAAHLETAQQLKTQQGN